MLTGEKRYAFSACTHMLADIAGPGLPFVQIVRDGGGVLNSNELILEGYFNDLYKLFLRKLAEFDCATHCGDTQKDQLKAVLDELIKVKGMLVENDTQK